MDPKSRLLSVVSIKSLLYTSQLSHFDDTSDGGNCCLIEDWTREEVIIGLFRSKKEKWSETD